jgi:hypothetical protein
MKNYDAVENGDSWEKVNWRLLRRNLIRLQVRIYKAVQVGNVSKVKNLQRLAINSYGARILAIREVTSSTLAVAIVKYTHLVMLSSQERFQMERNLKEVVKLWKPIDSCRFWVSKDGRYQRGGIACIIERKALECLIKFILEPAHEPTFHSRTYGFRSGYDSHYAQSYICSHFRKGFKVILSSVIGHIGINAFQFLSKRLLVSKWVICLLQKHLALNFYIKLPGYGDSSFSSPLTSLLTNLVLNGIVFFCCTLQCLGELLTFLKSYEDETHLHRDIVNFLGERRLILVQKRVLSTPGMDEFDFLGWHFGFSGSQECESSPSLDNLCSFRKVIKRAIKRFSVNLQTKALILDLLIKVWLNYHKYSLFSLNLKYILGKLVYRKLLAPGKVSQKKVIPVLKRSLFKTL